MAFKVSTHPTSRNTVAIKRDVMFLRFMIVQMSFSLLYFVSRKFPVVHVVGDAGIKIQRQPTKWIATKQQIKDCPIKNHVFFILLMFLAIE